MKNLKVSSIKHSLTYGIICGFLLVFLSFLNYFNNGYVEKVYFFTTLSFLLIIAICIYSIIIFKRKNEGFLAVWQAIKIGLSIATISALITGIWTWVLFKVIDPELPNQIIENSVHKNIQRSASADLNEQQVKQLLAENNKIDKAYLLSFFFRGVLVDNLFFGFLASLLGGIIMRRKKEDYYDSL